MPAWFTRASHPELPSVVMPADAVELYPDWVAYGEPSTDIDALNADLFREAQAADPAFAPPADAPAAPAPARARAKAAPAVPDPEPPAPVGADSKE